MLRSRIQLKIALVTELFAPSVGGQQTRFEELARSLAADGDDVTVFCTRNSAADPSTEVSGNVKIVRGPLLTHYEWTHAKKLQRSPWGVLQFSVRVRRELREQAFDVAYFNQWPYVHVLLAPKALRHRSGIDWCEYRSGAVHRLFQWMLPRLVAINATVNEWTGTKIEEASGHPVHYLPSGVDLAHYRHTPTERRSGLLFLGRLVENKNLPLLIKGYDELNRRGLDESLWIAGDGPERGLLEAEIARLGREVRERIQLEGQVDEPRKLELLASCRALLLPSIREGFPNVIAEAIASRLPIATVSSPLNGAASVVERYGVGVVGPATPQGFATAVEEVLRSEALLSARCVDAGRELDWTILGRDLHRLLEKAVANDSTGGAAP